LSSLVGAAQVAVALQVPGPAGTVTSASPVRVGASMSTIVIVKEALSVLPCASLAV